MAVLIVLLSSRLIFRALGAFGVPPFATWQDSARHALAVMFVFTATAHFNKIKHDLARMIPSFFPQPLMIVYITGVLESWEQQDCCCLEPGRSLESALSLFSRGCLLLT